MSGDTSPLVSETTRSSARTIAAWNLASRVTGFGRVLAIGVVLGKTDLGNTYQSANMVSTVLFELLVAGTLSASLVPQLVRAGAERQRALTRSLVSVIALAMAILGGLVAVAAEPIMRLLTAAVDRPDVRAQEITLGAFWLRLFAPQLVAYAVAAVASAALAAQKRFVAAAAGPLVNNLLVIATAVFAWWRADRSELTLNLSSELKVILGVGTTLGVVALAALPAAALGIRSILPTVHWDREDVAATWRSGVWASGTFAAFHVLGLAAVVVASRVPGGAVAFTTAVAFAAVPHAVFVHPVITASYPGLVEAAQIGRARFDQAGSTMLRRLLDLAVPATVLGVIGAVPVMVLATFGALSDTGAGVRIGPVLAILVVGLVGRALFDSFQRVAYAVHDVRSPTYAALVGLVLALVVMAMATRSSGEELVWGAAAGYVAGQLVMGALAAAASRRRGEHLLRKPTWHAAVMAGLWVAPASLVLLVGSWGSRSSAALTVLVIVAVGGAGWIGGRRMTTARAA